MREKLEMHVDEYTKKYQEMFSRVMKDADKGCIVWWQKQPVDFFQETIECLERTMLRSNPQEIGIALTHAESELGVYVRFHKKAKAWAESMEIMHPEFVLAKCLVQNFNER